MKTKTKFRRTLSAIVLLSPFGLLAGVAEAIEVNAVAQSKPIGEEVAVANTLLGVLKTPPGSGNLSQIDGAVNARNLWTGKNFPSAGDREFLYVQQGASIEFDLTVPANGGVPAATATLLWGSPDTHNKLELLLEGTVVATIVPGAAIPGGTGTGVPNNSNFTYLVSIADVEFDALRFSASGIAFEFANLAVTPLFDGSLGCGDAEVEPGTSLRRLNDVGLAVGDACAPPLPSRLDFDGSTLSFLADYAVLEGAEPAFAFDVAWRTEWIQGVGTPQAIPFTGINPPTVPTTAQAAPLSVQWFGASPEPVEPHLLDYCPGTPEFAVDPESGDPVLDEEGNPVLVGLEFPAGFETSDNDMSSELPGFQYGCLIRREVELLEESLECPVLEEPVPANLICVQVRESGYLRGDWKTTRTLLR